MGVSTAANAAEVVWHDLECGGYREDLPLWRELAAETGGPVLDIGAGTGRVTLDLAATGVHVTGLDLTPALLDALAVRAAGLDVDTVAADAREFGVDRRFALIVVPMQTIQLFGGAAGRAAFLSRAREHLAPGGIIAAAIADAMDSFDDDHPLAPPADTRTILGVTCSSQLLDVTDEDGVAAIHRRREIGGRHAEDVVIRLDRVSPEQVVSEAVALGYRRLPDRRVPETEQYLGSTVVVLSV